MHARKIITLVLCVVGFSQLSTASEIGFEPVARYRFQQVNDSVRGDASANTLKLRVNVLWEANDYFEGLVQGDHVHAFNEQKYNSVSVLRATSPIPEPQGSEINQAWIKYKSEGNWNVVFGRQLLNLDNERHVSGIEFWQNDQTFDAITYQYNDSTDWNIKYSYIAKAHRIYGDDSRASYSNEDLRFGTNIVRPFLELGNHKHKSHLLNVNYSINRYVDVTAFAYLLTNKTADQLSSDTYGFRINGEAKPSSIKYGYTAELSHQKTSSSNPWKYSGFYGFAELSAQYKSHQLALAYERLSEKNGFAFATSLGNSHKFLGWADIYSSYMNTDGLRDTLITYRGRNAKLRWRIVAHQFESDTSGSVAGHEIDLEIAYRFNRKWQATLLASKYLAKNGIDGLLPSQSDLSTWTISLSYNL